MITEVGLGCVAALAVLEGSLGRRGVVRAPAVLARARHDRLISSTKSVGELRSDEIAAWRITLSSGSRFDATQALRHVLARAVVWGMIGENPAKLRVDNPSPRRREQHPFESRAELDAVAAHLPPRYLPMVLFAPPPDFVPLSGSRLNGATSTWVRGSSTSTDRSRRVD